MTIVMSLSLSGDYDIPTLQQIAEDDIIPQLERIPGVAQAEAFGGGRTQYQVQVNADRLEAYGLSFSDVTGALSSSNIQSSAGEVTDNGIDYDITLDERYETLSQIEDTVITTIDGQVVRVVGDVAQVVVGEEEGGRQSYLNGEPISSISITASSDSNETTVASAVREALGGIIDTLPEDVHLNIQRDSTESIVDTMARSTTPPGGGLVRPLYRAAFFLQAYQARCP